MPEMRPCKECGKLFMPKGREVYCSDTHYRPCPICGEPVIAKYLSDPPRKCDKCKGKRTATQKSTSKLFKFNDSGFDKSFKFEPAQKKEKQKKEEKPEDIAVPEVNEEFAEPLQRTSDIKTDDLILKAEATTGPEAFCEMVNGSVRRYIGIQLPKNFGFVPGHDYLLKAEKADYVFYISATEDLTTGEEVNIMVPYSSQISFHQHFARINQKEGVA